MYLICSSRYTSEQNDRLKPKPNTNVREYGHEHPDSKRHNRTQARKYTISYQFLTQPWTKLNRNTNHSPNRSFRHEHKPEHNHCQRELLSHPRIFEDKKLWFRICLLCFVLGDEEKSEYGMCIGVSWFNWMVEKDGMWWRSWTEYYSKWFKRVMGKTNLMRKGCLEG